MASVLPLCVNSSYLRKAEDSFHSAFDAVRELADDSLAVGKTWNADRVVIYLHESIKREDTSLSAALLEICDNGRGISPTDFRGAYFSLGVSHSGGEDGPLYSRYGHGAFLSQGYLADHTITLSKARGADGCIVWTAAAFGRRVQPGGDAEAPMHAARNALHYQLATDLQQPEVQQRYRGFEEEQHGLAQGPLSALTRSGGCVDSPFEDVKALLDAFEKFEPETGVRILLVLKEGVRLCVENGEIVDQATGKALRQEIAHWFLPRTHTGLMDRLPEHLRPPPQEVTVQGKLVDWSSHPWCVQAAKPGSLLSPALTVPLAEGHEVLMQFLHPDPHTIPSATDDVPGFTSGLFLAYRPNKAIRTTPFIPEKKQALRTTYLNKVASTGPRSKIGREKLRELSGLDAVAFEALLPAKDYERVDWKVVKAAMGMKNVAALVLVQGHKVELLDNKADLKSAPETDAVYDAVWQQLIKWVLEELHTSRRRPASTAPARALAPGPSSAAAAAASAGALVPYTRTTRTQAAQDPSKATFLDLDRQAPPPGAPIGLPASSLPLLAADLVGSKVAIWASEEGEMEPEEGGGWQLAMVEAFDKSSNTCVLIRCKQEGGGETGKKKNRAREERMEGVDLSGAIVRQRAVVLKLGAAGAEVQRKRRRAVQGKGGGKRKRVGAAVAAPEATEQEIAQMVVEAIQEFGAMEGRTSAGAAELAKLMEAGRLKKGGTEGRAKAAAAAKKALRELAAMKEVKSRLGKALAELSALGEALAVPQGQLQQQGQGKPLLQAKAGGTSKASAAPR